MYDIQTSYKGAVYSIKLKIEFSILNQLMNLVKGAAHDASASALYGQTARSRPRRSIRAADLGHFAGAYSRMDEEGGDTGGIKLRTLRAGEISKTTTTEVRVDELEIEKNEVYSPAGKKKDSSRESSEVYIIEGRCGV